MTILGEPVTTEKCMFPRKRVRESRRRIAASAIFRQPLGENMHIRIKLAWTWSIVLYRSFLPPKLSYHFSSTYRVGF